jgi:DNA repair protein RecO (recombination protein O)
MAAEERSPAIVLRARDYSESDLIVTALTRDMGKLSGIARGAKASRRRFTRKLEPLVHAILYFRRRPHGELVFITRAEPLDEQTPALDDDLTKIALGSYMVELCDALTSEESEAAAAYHLLADGLRCLGIGGSPTALRQAFELKMLAWAGFGLEFARCRLCATPIEDAGDRLFFVAARGGVVCARCRPAAPESAVAVSVGSALALAALVRSPIAVAGTTLSAGGPDAGAALARFIASIIDRRLRSVDFLDSIVRPRTN